MNFFTIPATYRERKRPQARFGNLFAALEAIAVAAVLETTQRRVDLVQRLRLHLDERELDVFLDVDLGAFALIQDLALRFPGFVDRMGAAWGSRLKVGSLRQRFSRTQTNRTTAVGRLRLTGERGVRGAGPASSTWSRCTRT